MRHTFKLLAATVAAATICSCSTLTGYPTDAEASYAKAIEIAKKSVDTDKFKVYSLSFMEGETLSDNLFLISVKLVNRDNQAFSQSYYMTGLEPTALRDVQRTFARLHDAITPGGSLVFDVHAVSKMEKLDGEVLLDEREDVFCLWRTRYRKNVKMLDYEVDLFRLQPDGAWERDFEEHHQRAYTVEELTAWLEEAAFSAIRTHGELKLRRANERDGRIYFSCIRK